MILPKVLSIAGFDPTSGAGIIADMKTAEAFKCYGFSAITAIVLQDSTGVRGATPVEATLLKKQIDLLLHDTKIQSAKVGVLASEENVKVVAASLSSKKIKHIVVDPILSSSSGYPFLDEKGIHSLKEDLLPITEVIAPNISEASILSGIEVKDLETMKKAAKEILALGVTYIVLKGGHLGERAMDLLYDGKRFHLFDSAKVKGEGIHGLGCAFSMALACSLARGEEVYHSVHMAKTFISRLLSRPIKIGKGKSVLHHMIR